VAYQIAEVTKFEEFLWHKRTTNKRTNSPTATRDKYLVVVVVV